MYSITFTFIQSKPNCVGDTLLPQKEYFAILPLGQLENSIFDILDEVPIKKVRLELTNRIMGKLADANFLIIS